MALQSTIDRINDAIAALGQQKDLLLRGNSDRPNSDDIAGLSRHVRSVCIALDDVCDEYEIQDASFASWACDVDFDRAGELADERLRERRSPRWASEDAFR